MGSLVSAVRVGILGWRSRAFVPLLLILGAVDTACVAVEVFSGANWPRAVVSFSVWFGAALVVGAPLIRMVDDQREVRRLLWYWRIARFILVVLLSLGLVGVFSAAIMVEFFHDRSLVFDLLPLVPANIAAFGLIGDECDLCQHDGHDDAQACGGE